MSSENDEFFGLLASFDFSDHVCGLDRSADLIWNAQVRHTGCPEASKRPMRSHLRVPTALAVGGRFRQRKNLCAGKECRVRE